MWGKKSDQIWQALQLVLNCWILTFRTAKKIVESLSETTRFKSNINKQTLHGTLSICFHLSCRKLSRRPFIFLDWFSLIQSWKEIPNIWFKLQSLLMTDSWFRPSSDLLHMFVQRLRLISAYECLYALWLWRSKLNTQRVKNADNALYFPWSASL